MILSVVYVNMPNDISIASLSTYCHK